MRHLLCVVVFLPVFSPFIAKAQNEMQSVPNASTATRTHEYLKKRAEWFYRGRVLRGQSSAELRRRAHQAKLQMRAQRASALVAQPHLQVPLSSGSWLPLGPVPLASDASGNGTQNYGAVAGRATAIAIDPADPSGNTIYIGGAQAGVWKSTNAADLAGNVRWTPLTDNQPTLSIGTLAIQPGNSDPTKSVILAATGEADNSADSYFGLGILRSSDAGNTWSLVRTANNGALSFSGLGGTRMAFSVTNSSAVVAAMATSSEGLIDGAVTSATMRGLYTSLDAGATWNYDSLSDAGAAIDPTSATSVVFNSKAGSGLFFAAIRYHGFYSSPDGVNWTRLANQPGGAVLASSACPPQSTSNGQACPIYRGELAVLPGRNEMYAWYIYFAPDGSTADGGIWQSVDGGASWRSISDTGITNCGDVEGCGVDQGAYNLELIAVPNGAVATDLYVGAENLYKCSLQNPSGSSPACSNGFLNLTHAYGCVPAGAPAHVHPDQHALAAAIPTTGSASGNALMFFANDGGIYRALNAFLGLTSGLCSGANQFDDLNQNLGSMTQFVSFSQHPTDPNTLLGGTQDNGSPATNQAMTSSNWINVLGGDGGYNAIDVLAPLNWYASNPDVPPGGLGIQFCPGGVNCNNSSFNFVVTSSTLGGDDGAFYFPYILDPSSLSAMLVGTCRVWRGPKTGGAFSALSPNFDTLGTGVCSGGEVNQVTAIAAGGLSDPLGSSVIYATTSGLGPLDGSSVFPSGGHVWRTVNASDGSAAFVDVTANGPQGSINPNQFPISSVAIDPSDPSGNTAYVTIMGFTGGPGHVWKTINAGATWTDFTANLPDSPVNAVLVYVPMSQVFVGTDVGVFSSPTSAPNWTELGPAPGTNQAGFLPNVAVTALGVFASGGQQLLRASTYGRGMWQFNLVITPDFQLSVSPLQQTAFAGQSASFSGTVTAANGYANSVAFTCVAGTTVPPSTCSVSPSSLTPTSKTPFTVTVGGATDDYSFNVQATGSDSSHITHKYPLTLHVVNFAISNPSPTNVTVARGTTSTPVRFQISASGSFSGAVAISCTTVIANATCNLSPGATVNPTSSNPVNMTASVIVPAGSAAGIYAVTLQASTAGASPLTTSFNLNVTANPDFVLSGPPSFPEVNAGSSGTSGTISVASQDGFNSSVTLSCSVTGGPACSVNPASVSSFPASATLVINAGNASAGAYSASVTGTSGSLVQTISIPFNVGNYVVAGPQTASAVPGAQVTANFTLTSLSSYSGKINATCDASALPAAICSLAPGNPITVASGGSAVLNTSVKIPQTATAGSYVITFKTQDTTGAPSHTATLTITVTPDFRVLSSTASQSVKAGQTTGAYNLAVQPVGISFNAPVTLACTAGMPSGAQCIFSPSGPVTPGSTPVDVVMSISTAASQAARIGHWKQDACLYGNWLVLPAMMLIWPLARPFRALRKHMYLSAIVAACLVSVSCGGSSTAGGGGGPPPVNPVTYHVTVTGSSPGTPPDSGQGTTVTLVVD
jgi:hypothetical protein